MTDPTKIDAELEIIRRLEPTVVATAHGPAANGVSQHLCDMLSGVSTLDALRLPTQEDLDHMLAGAPVG